MCAVTQISMAQVSIRAGLHQIVDGGFDEAQRPHLHDLIDSLSNPEQLREIATDTQMIQSYSSKEST
jgi:hypothetical protein